MKDRILFVNATYIKKINTFQAAKKLGLDVTVIGLELPEWAKPYVDNYYYANTYDIEETINIIKEKNIEFDGVITFWDRDVVPVAIIANEFGVIGCGIEAAKRARNKFKMREALKINNVPHPEYMLVRNTEDVTEVCKKMNFPVIIKPVGASASKGVFKVEKPSDLKNAFNTLKKYATPDNDMMFSFDYGDYIVEEFMEGEEVSVEGIISNGDIYIVGITEKKVDEHFEEYSHAFPARLSSDVENSIIEITKASIKAMELDNCGFHAEIKITDGGCKIVEVNGRIAGDFLPSHLIPLSKGIDITEANLLMVLGKKFDLSEKLQKGACVRFIMAEKQGYIKEWENVEDVKRMKGVVDFVIEKEAGCYVGLPPEVYHEARLAYVIAVGENTEEAIANAERAISEVRCEISDAR